MCTRRLKRTVTCPDCSFIVCENCLKHYILDRTDDIHCMNCKRNWPSNLFSPAFYKGAYKVHRQKILFAREQSLMPETQPLVLREIEIRNLKHIIDDFKKRYPHTWRYDPTYRDLMTQLDFLRDTKPEPINKSKPFRKCQQNNCRGFFEDDGVCTMCQTVTCVKCAEKYHEGHVCNPDTLESIKLIESDSKPCPKCKAAIFRIEGCLHMWCTQCNTSFHWKTGQIYAKPMANPHYSEFIRNGGNAPREITDILCGGVPSMHNWFHTWYNRYMSSTDLQQVTSIMSVHNTAISEERRVVDGARDTTLKLQNLRMRFMMGEITEAVYKTHLFAIDKAQEKEREELVVYHLFCTVIGDLFRNLLGEQDKGEVLESCVTITEYCNELLEKISKRFGQQPKKIVI